MIFSKTEQEMWKDLSSDEEEIFNDKEINEKYESKEQRILIEMNREKLPNFVKSLERPNYMDLQPSYQRRERWNPRQQSQLIESFIVNVPVPPIVLYEKSYDSYEVMDGQQRINAILAFYKNKLELTGLELWKELNGYTYETLPEKIRAGIDRRSISSVVLITESTTDPEEAMLLKQFAFSRLNTGGVDLSRQEVRNCLYTGQFNTLMKELADNDTFKDAWKINSSSSLYKSMGDIELILRFFAFRHIDNLRGSQERFFDLYMYKSQFFSVEDIDFLKSIFIKTLELVHELYGKNMFRPFNKDTQEWENRPHKAYYDAVMVGLSRHLSQSSVLIKQKQKVVEATKQLFIGDEKGLLKGAGKNKSDIQKRIDMYVKMLKDILD